MSNQSVPTPDALCPWCGYHFDRAWNHEGAKPAPGDLSMCFGCGEWTMLDDDLMPTKPDDAGFEWIANDETARRYREAWVRFKLTKDT